MGVHWTYSKSIIGQHYLHIKEDLISVAQLRLKEFSEVSFERTEIEMAFGPGLVSSMEPSFISLAVIAYPLGDNPPAWKERATTNAEQVVTNSPCRAAIPLQ